jgi:hypothetical protein
VTLFTSRIFTCSWRKHAGISFSKAIARKEILKFPGVVDNKTTRNTNFVGIGRLSAPTFEGITFKENVEGRPIVKEADRVKDIKTEDAAYISQCDEQKNKEKEFELMQSITIKNIEEEKILLETRPGLIPQADLYSLKENLSYMQKCVLSNPFNEEYENLAETYRDVNVQDIMRKNEGLTIQDATTMFEEDTMHCEWMKKELDRHRNATFDPFVEFSGRNKELEDYRKSLPEGHPHLRKIYGNDAFVEEPKSYKPLDFEEFERQELLNHNLEQGIKKQNEREKANEKREEVHRKRTQKLEEKRRLEIQKLQCLMAESNIHERVSE